MLIDSPIFIVGCPRSGTSLLRNLLRSHPRLTFPQESHFIPSFYRNYGNPTNSSEAIALARRILSLRYIQDWGLEITPAAFEAERSFAGVVDSLFSAWAKKEDKPRWGDKTPQYVEHLPVLIEIFPDARFIHVIRDGRDAALSWFRTGFGPKNAYVAAKTWQRFVRAGREAGEKLSAENYLEIKYESLVLDPEKNLKNICDFLGEMYTPDLLIPTPIKIRGPRRYIPQPHPTQGMDRTQRKTEIISSNASPWKTLMPAGDVARFEAVAGDLLHVLQYETSESRYRITFIEKIFWQVHHFLLSFWWKLTSRNKAKWIWTDLSIRYSQFRTRFLR